MAIDRIPHAPRISRIGRILCLAYLTIASWIKAFISRHRPSIDEDAGNPSGFSSHRGVARAEGVTGDYGLGVQSQSLVPSSPLEDLSARPIEHPYITRIGAEALAQLTAAGATGCPGNEHVRERGA